jgi:ubiquinone/menaquinone biosynthesis C-methylase UbiE
MSLTSNGGKKRSVHDDALTDLHAPLIPILRHVLAAAPLPRVGFVLDLACGQGLKASLLIEALGPHVRLLGVDVDRAAIRAATTDDRRPTAEDRGLKIEDSHVCVDKALSSTLDPLSSNNQLILGVVGDALALPLIDGCCAAAFCIAALSLFADRRAALRELRRVLAPGGFTLLVVGTQSWAQTIRWPTDLVMRLAVAYTQALAEGVAPLHATPDLGSELSGLLLETGFATPLIRAFQLDRLTTNDRRPTTNDEAINSHLPSPISYPLTAELPLLPWSALRALLAARLDAIELARCDELAADPDVELCALALVVQARTA